MVIQPHKELAFCQYLSLYICVYVCILPSIENLCENREQNPRPLLEDNCVCTGFNIQLLGRKEI